jgi:nucleoside-diphosphate-sugar epimerase
MDRLTTSEPVNLGTGQEVSIRQLTDLIARLAGFTGRTEWDTARPEGQPRRSLDITRARQLLGFEPRISLETGLQQTIDWYRAARSKGR